MHFDPKTGNGGLPYDPVKAIVAPRPIGWISTVDAKGSANLAPYSFFNLVSAKPAVVGFSSQGIKDSARNAIETREFVCNFAGAALMDQMNLSSLPLPPGESEFARAGLEAVASVCVAPPRVKGVAAALECRVVDVIGVKDAAGVPTGWHFVLGDVVGVFIDDAFIGDGRFRTDAAAPVSRCGYRDYNVCDVLFELRRYSDG